MRNVVLDAIRSYLVCFVVAEVRQDMGQRTRMPLAMLFF